MAFAERPRSRHGSGLPAVTPEQIADAAVDLTAGHGVEAWTLRQLAASIEASPAVIYHHVGDREAVVRLVLDRVVREMRSPLESLPWREWFACLLDDQRDVLRRYPGVAYRLTKQAEPPDAGIPIVEEGMRKLREAGFGDECALAFNVLVTTAYQYIALEDAPSRRTEDDRDDLFRYAVQRCLDGLEHRLWQLDGMAR